MASAPETSRANRKVGAIMAVVALGMLGLGFAAVPFYRIFCQATGYNGTTQRATIEQAAHIRASGQMITIRFDANVAPGMKWVFHPLQVTQDGRIGERKLALFYARNTSDHAIVGRAVFNVTPAQTGIYFHKIQCFCFNNQRLEPGQEMRMPVIYYVDPEMLKDKTVNELQEITLSYTFLPAANAAS